MERSKLSVTRIDLHPGRVLLCSLTLFILFFIIVPLSVHAGSAWDSYTAGLRAMEAGNCVAAKKYFTEAIAKDPRDRKIRRGMFFDYYQPNAKLKELGPCQQQLQGKITLSEPVRIVLYNPVSNNAEYPYEDAALEAKWRVTGGSGDYSVTVDGNQVTADAEGLYSSTLSLAPGENIFTLSAYDREHNKVETTTLQLRRQPPSPLEIALLSPISRTAEYSHEKESVEAKWCITGGSGHFLVTVDGNNITPDAEGFYTAALPLDPGENTFNLSVFDKEHSKVETTKLHLTRLPPPPVRIALMTPPSGSAEFSFDHDTVEAKWLVAGGSGQYSVTMDGTPVSPDAQGVYVASLPLETGENTFNLSVFDTKHNKVESTSLTIRRLPPPPLNILLLNPVSTAARYPYENDRIDLKWRLTGGSGKATVTVNGTPAQADSSGIYNFSLPMKQGENIIDVVAFDKKLGPEKSEKVRLVLTRLEPPPLELYVANDPHDSRTNKDSIILQGKVAGLVGGGSLTVNGAPMKITGDGRFEHLASLEVGDNNLQIRLEDGLQRVKTARIQVKRTRNPLAGVDVGNFYALIIGNNDYPDPQINSLETPINDARAIAKVLKENYGFNVKVLENATRRQIILEFNEFRKMLTEKDNFLVYYAGHGFMDKAEDEGYWLPVDAKKEIDDKWIPNSTISNKMRAIKARHVLLVTDSCYSGTLTKTRDLAVRKKGAGYLKEIVERKSRLVMTSGGEEPVADDGGKKGHSVFASGFLREMEANDEILESADLYMNVKKYVRNAKDQVPAYSALPKTGHELGGDFLFIRKK